MNVVLVSLLAMHLGANMPSEAALKAYEDHSYTYTGGDYKDEAFHYRLMSPAKIEQGKRYPLIVFLHGAGERGEDNKVQLLYFPEMMASAENRAKYPCFVFAPQCREKKKWVEVDWSASTTEQPKDPGDQMKVVIAVMNELEKKYPVDSNRIYLTGLSMGGFGSWDLAARDPKHFAAVVPICGGADLTTASRLVDVPLWVVHGSADPAVPVERSRKMVEAVKKAGGNPHYTELEGVGHNSWDPAYHDPKGPVPWMFEQVNKRRGADKSASR